MSAARSRSRIERIVTQHATAEAKQQFREEQAWRSEHEHNNLRNARKERRPVIEQSHVLLRLKTEGLRELWELVKDNHTVQYQNEYCRRNNTPCWIWQACRGGPFTTKQGYGYIALLGLGKTSLMVTHLALWTRCSTLQPSRRFHVSHRCHTPACFNPDHLCQEHREINSARNGCLAFRDAECLISDCIHNPPCIVAFRENMQRVRDRSTVTSTSGILYNSTNTVHNRKRKLSAISSAEGEGEDDEKHCIDLVSD